MSSLLEQEERDAVAINPGMLRDEFVSFPGLLSDFGARYAEAISAATAAKEALKDLEAEVYLELRATKSKEDTEAVLTAKLRRDPRVRMARDLFVAAEAKETRFKHKVMDPLYAKKEMIVSIGAHQRAELNGDPLVRHAKVTIEDMEGKLFDGR